MSFQSEHSQFPPHYSQQTSHSLPRVMYGMSFVSLISHLCTSSVTHSNAALNVVWYLTALYRCLTVYIIYSKFATKCITSIFQPLISQFYHFYYCSLAWKKNLPNSASQKHWQSTSSMKVNQSKPILKIHCFNKQNFLQTTRQHWSKEYMGIMML